MIDDDPRTPPARADLSGWALTFSVAGLVASLFVGWMLPLGLVGAITAIVALRRRTGSGRAVWALVLGVVAVLYSAGWVVWAILRVGVIGP